MDLIEMLLRGELSAEDFVLILYTDDELDAAVQGLIPAEALNDSEHSFWKTCINRSRLEPYQFRVRNFLREWYGYGDRETDRTGIFDTMERLYTYNHPDFRARRPMTEFDFRLEIAGDTYGGSEVDALIERIASETGEITPKSARKKEAKQRIIALFHTEDGKKPRWVQEPEWPMGKSSPMKFVDRKKNGDKVDFRFADVDTGEERTVTQFY